MFGSRKPQVWQGAPGSGPALRGLSVMLRHLTVCARNESDSLVGGEVQTSTTGQQKEASLETNDMVTSSPKTANAPAAQVPSEGATGRRLYSKVVTDTRPPQSTTRSQQGSMAIGDIISFIFSVLPKFVAILPPGIFKTILQGAMLLQPAIVEMTRNLQQCHG